MTFGISDYAKIANAMAFAAVTGGDVGQARETTRGALNNLKAANPWTYFGGQIAGTAAQTIATAGLSSGASAASGAKTAVQGAELAQGAKAAVQGAEAAQALGTAAKVGQGAYRTAEAVQGAEVATQLATQGAKLVEKPAASLLSRMAAKAVKQGATDAGWGALYGASDELNRQIMEGDGELSGQKILGAAGGGALLGGALGAGLGAGGELAKPGIAALKASTKGLTEKLSLEALADGFKVSKPIIRKMDERAGGVANVMRTVRDHAGIGASVDDQLLKVETALQKSGSKIDDVLSRASAGEKLEHKLTAGQVYDDIVSKFSSGDFKELNKGVANQGEVWARDLMRNMGAIGEDGLVNREARLGVKELAAAKTLFGKEMDRRGLWKLAPIGQEETVLKSATRDVYDLLRSKTSEVIERQGGTEAKELREVNKVYSHLRLAQDALEDTAGLANSKRLTSFTDRIMGATAVGGAFMSGNPLAALAAPAVAMGSKVLRERGGFIGAQVLDKLSGQAAIRAAEQAVDKNLESGFSKFVKQKGAKSGGPLLPASPETAFNTVKKNIENQDPAKNFDRTADMTNKFTSVAPNAAGAALAASQRAMVFMATVKPPEWKPPSIQDYKQEGYVSPYARDAYVQRAAMAQYPLRVIPVMQANQLTDTQVDVLKAVYPDLYAKMQQDAIAALADTKTPLSLAKHQQLSKLLGTPTDGSLDPKVIKRLQETYADSGSGGQQQKQPGGPISPKRAESITRISESTAAANYGGANTME